MRQWWMGMFFTIAVAFACAAPKPVAQKPPAAAPKVAATTTASSDVRLPHTLSEVKETLGHRCPGPMFQLDQKETVTIRGKSFVVEGSHASLVGEAASPLRIGVIGAPKDADTLTRANIKKANAEFKKAGVQLILINGDLADSGVLSESGRMIAQETTFPVLIHSGNIEWTTAFTEIIETINAESPTFLNLNVIRTLDLGGIHLVSVPGWSNVRYVKAAACRYDVDNINEVRPYIHAARARGELVVVTAHGPPRGRGKQAIDFADEAGNVGDENLAALLVEEDVRFGIFGHILEAGGRATGDVEIQQPLPLPMRKPVDRLYINVGSASSFGWQLLNKTTSRGMAAVVSFDKNSATGKVNFIKLR